VTFSTPTSVYDSYNNLIVKRLAIMLPLILFAVAFMQTAIAPPPDSANEISIYAELKKPMSSSIATGHEVQLVVTKDVHRADGAVVIPHGAKLIGKITVARQLSNDQPAALSFVVQKAEWKKQSLPLNATIDRIESMGIDRQNQVCMPDLDRMGGVPCGGVTQTILGVPTDCSIGKPDSNSQENAVLCKRREVAFKSGAIIVLMQTLVSSTGGQPTDTARRSANPHPSLDLPPEQLVKRIPELKTLQTVQDQQLLQTILSKTGGRVSDFLRQVVDLTAHEEITQENLDETGRTKSSRRREYSYLVLLHRNDLSPTPEEYRTDAKGNRVAPSGVDQGYAVTSGFAFACLRFLPGNQPNSTFRYLGTETVGGRNTYVIAFAQRADQAKTSFVNLQGLEIPIVVQGVGWIDQENFQLIRMRTDLLGSLPLSQMLPESSGRSGLDQQTTEVTFAETHLLGVANPLWLPSEVSVQTVFNGDAFHNEHRYTNYQRFHVTSRIDTP
jgi:hypothetical protein